MLTMRIIAAAAAALATTLAGAQTDPKAELRAAIEGALKPMLGDGSAQVVEKLKGVKPSEFISAKFDLARIKNTLFPRLATNDAPDCRTTTTPTGERDTGLCVVDWGNRDVGEAAYRMLAFSKNIGIGDVMFARRDVYTGQLPNPVTLSDAQAYDQALKFLVEVIGVPRSEIPALPEGARLPVRSMAIGSADERGGNRMSIVTHKVVSIPRAFFVPGGLGTDPQTGHALTHVVAPGGASVTSDGSVRFARVDGWADAQLDMRGAPKSTAALVSEITDDLFGEGARKVGTISILIALRKAYPNPDDPNPPPCPVCGVLRPALRVVVSPALRDKPPAEPSWVAPGLAREYDLVGGQSEFDRTAPR